MKYLYEEVAYLKGLAEGLEISKETKEGKIIHKIIDVLESFADSIVELDEEQCDLAEYVESSDDLSFIEMECPNCNDLVEIDEELLYDDEVDVVCPNCKAIILSSDDDDYSCTDCDCEE